jgi:hypothetical protein
MPLGTDAWTSSTIAVVALACALIGMASRNAQLRNCDDTIAKLRRALDPADDGGAARRHRPGPSD